MDTLIRNPEQVGMTMTGRDYRQLFLLTLFMYIPGLLVPLMDNDSAHHANIALRMYLEQDYTSLYDYDKPYLDKPHLLFWTAALFYKLLGVTTIAYKLPSFLFAILGTYSTFRLGVLLYGRETGRLAALIVSTSFAYVLATNDVRMDAMLTGAAAFALWQLVAYTKKRRLHHLVLAALGLALAFATKGMVGVVVPGIALLLYLLYERNWRMIFHPKWLLLLLLFFVFISPVLYAYYLQFDLHPELEVRGRSNVSGVRFILWNQNFERMQGESFGASGDTEYAYFLHTFLWAFMPWSILCIIAIFSRTKEFITTRFRYKPGLEFLTLGSVLFFMVLFSLSRFKLPHYLNVLFPLFALLLASYLQDRQHDPQKLKLHWRIQFFVILLMFVVGMLLNAWLFPISKVWIMLIGLALFFVFLGTLFSIQDLYRKTIYWTVTGMVLLLFLVNANFYPQLLSYQSGNVLAAIAKKENADQSRVFPYRTGYNYSYDFYTAAFHYPIGLEAIIEMKRSGEPLWLITDEQGIADLEASGLQIRSRYATPDFHVSLLNWRFLNPATRAEATTVHYLLQL